MRDGEALKRKRAHSNPARNGRGHYPCPIANSVGGVLFLEFIRAGEKKMPYVPLWPIVAGRSYFVPITQKKKKAHLLFDDAITIKGRHPFFFNFLLSLSFLRYFCLHNGYMKFL